MKARGYVLASTLSILLLISTIALAVSFMGRLEHKAAERRSEKRQAELAARSASLLQKASWTISRGLIFPWSFWITQKLGIAQIFQHCLSVSSSGWKTRRANWT